MTTMTLKDASGSTHSFGTQILSGYESAGVWLRALPEGGATPYRNLSLDATGYVVKSSPGTLFAMVLCNCDETGSPPVGAADIFVKFYDKATTPSVGTDTPVWTVRVPAGENAQLTLPLGLAFLNGIGVAATMYPADSDATAPPANTVIANLMYN